MNAKDIQIKYVSVKESLIKSKTIICAYISAISSYLATNGSDLLNNLSDSLPQLQTVLNVRVFGWISFIATIGTIYFKLRSTKIVGVKDDISKPN